MGVLMENSFHFIYMRVSLPSVLCRGQRYGTCNQHGVTPWLDIAAIITLGKSRFELFGKFFRARKSQTNHLSEVLQVEKVSVESWGKSLNRSLRRYSDCFPKFPLNFMRRLLFQVKVFDETSAGRIWLFFTWFWFICKPWTDDLIQKGVRVLRLLI